jgi:hypothetical protein
LRDVITLDQSDVPSKRNAGETVTQDSACVPVPLALIDAADQAAFSFQKLGLYAASSIGIGSGGIIGGLYSAVKSADKFRLTQVSIANLMNDGVTPFNERLNMAQATMEKVNKLASEFALPAGDLMDLTKLVAPMIRTKNGMPDFTRATDLSRNLMKAAPTLGVGTGQVMGQFQNLIGGHTSMNDTLFQRLTADTKSMRGMRSQNFNALPEAKRIELLTKAMREFTADTSALKANVMTLSGQMQLLGDAFTSMFSILKPIGQTILNRYQKNSRSELRQVTNALKYYDHRPHTNRVERIYLKFQVVD